MPRSLKVLLALVIALLVWCVADPIIRQRLYAAADSGRELGEFEHVVVRFDLWVLRWFPYGFFPVVLAPEGAILAWGLFAKRASYTPPTALHARSLLRVWLTVLAAAVGLGVLAAAWSYLAGWHAAMILAMTALFAFSWSYAGALWAALWLQRRRNEAGLARLSASRLAVLVLLLAACAPTHLLGAFVPVWLLWVSRGQAAA